MTTTTMESPKTMQVNIQTDYHISCLHTIELPEGRTWGDVG